MKPGPATQAVIVVGGGWAGIAAAVELTRHDIPVILLESAKQLGGRARCVSSRGMHIDNGQHMLLGAYESTLSLLRTVGISEDIAFERRPLSLQWLRVGEMPVMLNTPALPAPLHLAWGLLRAKGLSLRDRLAALRMSRALQNSDFSLPQDCSVSALLEQHRQPEAVIRAIWEPLCLGALNTHIHEASAQLFLRTLGDSFRYSRRDSDLLLTRLNLGAILPEPALDYIETHGGSVRLGQRVIRLLMRGKQIEGVELRGDQLLAGQVILATPHTISRRLMKPHSPLRDTARKLEQIGDRPICTVYLQYPKDTRLHCPVVGSLGTLSQWVFDRGLYEQHGLMAVVISGAGEHMQWDNGQLCERVQQELAAHFPHWPAPESCNVIREKRATFAGTVNVNRHRPAARTAINGLWLAGDYIDVGLPATLEGAVRSGIESAQQVIRARRQAHTEKE